MLVKHIFSHRIVGMVAISNRLELQTIAPPTWQFNFPSFQATSYLKDGFSTRDGIKLHTGLEVTTYIECQEQINEKQILASIIEIILNLISLTTVASCENAEIISHIVIPAKKKTMAEFYSYPLSKDNIIIGTPRKINESNLNYIWTGWDKSEHKNRVMRALSWFRKGLSEDGNVDKFICNWVAIEVLKSILRRMLLSRRPKEWDGVKKVFELIGGDVDFDDVYETRCELLHGYQELNPEFLSKIANYVEPTRKALIICIFRALELPDTLASELASYVPRRMMKHFTAKIEGTLTSLPSSLAEIMTKPPLMEVDAKISKYRLKENGEVDYDIRTTYTARLPEKTVFTANTSRMRGHSEAGITGAIISKEFE